MGDKRLEDLIKGAYQDHAMGHPVSGDWNAFTNKPGYAGLARRSTLSSWLLWGGLSAVGIAMLSIGGDTYSSAADAQGASERIVMDHTAINYGVEDDLNTKTSSASLVGIPNSDNDSWTSKSRNMDHLNANNNNTGTTTSGMSLDQQTAAEEILQVSVDQNTIEKPNTKNFQVNHRDLSKQYDSFEENNIPTSTEKMNQSRRPLSLTRSNRRINAVDQVDDVSDYASNRNIARNANNGITNPAQLNQASGSLYQNGNNLESKETGSAATLSRSKQGNIDEGLVLATGSSNQLQFSNNLRDDMSLTLEELGPSLLDDVSETDDLAANGFPFPPVDPKQLDSTQTALELNNVISSEDEEDEEKIVNLVDPIESKDKNSGWQLGFNTSLDYSYYQLVNNAASTLEQSFEKSHPIHGKSSMQFSIGITAMYQIDDRFKIESGLNYAKRRSVDAENFFINGSQYNYFYDGRYIDIPVRLRYTFMQTKDFNLFVAPGIVLSQNAWNTESFVSEENAGRAELNWKSTGFLGEFSLGAEHQFNKKWQGTVMASYGYAVSPVLRVRSGYDFKAPIDHFSRTFKLGFQLHRKF